MTASKSIGIPAFAGMTEKEHFLRMTEIVAETHPCGQKEPLTELFGLCTSFFIRNDGAVIRNRFCCCSLETV